MIYFHYIYVAQHLLINELLLDIPMHFCDASHYVQPNAFYNFFLSHQILIAHETYNEIPKVMLISCQSRKNFYTLEFCSFEEHCMLWWKPIWFFQCSSQNLPFTWRKIIKMLDVNLFMIIYIYSPSLTLAYSQCLQKKVRLLWA
jgi:hypothetical protein